jgi:hypothetical protein
MGTRLIYRPEDWYDGPDIIRPVPLKGDDGFDATTAPSTRSPGRGGRVVALRIAHVGRCGPAPADGAPRMGGPLRRQIRPRRAIAHSQTSQLLGRGITHFYLRYAPGDEVSRRVRVWINKVAEPERSAPHHFQKMAGLAVQPTVRRPCDGLPAMSVPGPARGENPRVPRDHDLRLTPDASVCLGPRLSAVVALRMGCPQLFACPRAHRPPSVEAAEHARTPVHPRHEARPPAWEQLAKKIGTTSVTLASVTLTPVAGVI